MLGFGVFFTLLEETVLLDTEGYNIAIVGEPEEVFAFIEQFTVETGIVIGAIVAGIGLGICAWVEWELLEFISNPINLGVFNMSLTKIGTVGTTLAILGFQLIFSSFYSGLFSIEVTEETLPDHQG